MVTVTVTAIIAEVTAVTAMFTAAVIAAGMKAVPAVNHPTDEGYESVLLNQHTPCCR